MYRINLDNGGFFRFRTGNDSRASILRERPNKLSDAEPESRGYDYNDYQCAYRGVHVFSPLS